MQDTLTTALLRCGVIAGPLYIIVGAIQVLIRPGFDVRYNVLSQMALGDLGWIQTANFGVSGLLVIVMGLVLVSGQFARLPQLFNFL